LDHRPDWRIDALFAAVLLPPQIAAMLDPDKFSENLWVNGAYIQFIGVLFLLSYFFPNRSYVLKALMWCCEHTSTPVRGRWTAILWGSFAIFVGLLAQVHGFYKSDR
jgi:hypothetical protein